jgi:hypothetical protein
MSGASGPPSKPVKNATRNEKDRKRRADGLQRHQHALAKKQAEIDYLHGNLTGVWSGPRPGGLTLRLRGSWGTEVRGW